MKFLIYRCLDDPDHFLITDAEHASALTGSECPSGGNIEKVGGYPELGRIRAAFNEDIAKSAIRSQGYYRFEARTFDPVAQQPDAMPM